MSSFLDKDLKKALGSFSTGVVIAATIDQKLRRRGLTINAFMSVSLSPPTLLISIEQKAKSHDAFLFGDFFSVNVLSRNQKFISEMFATKRPDKFSAGEWRDGAFGCPLLEKSISWFECRKKEVVPVADHSLFLGEIQDFGFLEDAQPLTYWRKCYD